MTVTTYDLLLILSISKYVLEQQEICAAIL